MRSLIVFLCSSLVVGVWVHGAAASGPPQLYKCVDWECEEWISRGKTLLLYMGRTDKHLSFKKNQDILIIGKPVDDSSPDWIGKVGNKIGLVPKDYVREDKMNKGSPKFKVELQDIPAWSRNDEPVEHEDDEADADNEEDDDEEAENETGIEIEDVDENNVDSVKTQLPAETSIPDTNTESAVTSEKEQTVEVTPSSQIAAEDLQTPIVQPDSSIVQESSESQEVTPESLSSVLSEAEPTMSLEPEPEISSDPVVDSISLQPSTDTVLQGTTTTVEYLAETPKTEEQKPTDDITPRIPETVVLHSIASIQSTFSGAGFTTQLDSLSVTRVEKSSVSEEETQFTMPVEEKTVEAPESSIRSEVRMESEVNVVEESDDVSPRKVETVEPEKLPETMRMESIMPYSETVTEAPNPTVEIESSTMSSTTSNIEEPSVAEEQSTEDSVESSTPEPSTEAGSIDELPSASDPVQILAPPQEEPSTTETPAEVEVVQLATPDEPFKPMEDVAEETSGSILEAATESPSHVEDEIESASEIKEEAAAVPPQIVEDVSEVPEPVSDDVSTTTEPPTSKPELQAQLEDLQKLEEDHSTAQDFLTAGLSEQTVPSTTAVVEEEETVTEAPTLVENQYPPPESQSDSQTPELLSQPASEVSPAIPEPIVEVVDETIPDVIPTEVPPAQSEEAVPSSPVEEIQPKEEVSQEAAVEDHSSHAHDEASDDRHHHHHHHQHPRHSHFKDLNDTESSSIILVIKHLSSTLLSFLPEPLQDTILDVDDALVFTGTIALTLVSICVPYFFIEGYMSLCPLKKKVVELNKSLWKVSAAYETQQEEFEIFKQKAIAHDEFKKRAEQSENDVIILKKLDTKHREQITTLKSQRNSLMKEGADIRALIKKTLEDKAVVAEDCEKYKAAYESTKDSLTRAREELNSIQNQAKSSNLLLTVSGRNVQVLNSKISMLEQEAEDMKAQLLAENEKKKAVELEKQSIEQSKAAVVKELSDLKTICHQYEETVGNLNDEIAKLESELASIKETLGEDSPLLEVAEIQAKAAYSEREAESLRTRLGGLTADNDNLSAKLKAMSSVMEEALAEKEKTHNRLEVLEKYFKEREEEYIKTVDQLQLKESVRDKGKEELIKIIEEKDNVCKDLNDRLETLKEEFEETKQQHRNEMRTLEAKGHENWVALHSTVAMG